MSAGAVSQLPPPPRVGGNILAWCAEAWKHIRKNRVKAGKGMRSTQTEDGLILSCTVTAEDLDAGHPFKISADFDNAAAPTVCLVSIQSGSLQSSPYASGSTYAGIPLFEGSGGSLLNAATPPTYDVGVTTRTNYFYLVITTNVYGLVNTVWIDHLLAAAVPPVDVPYVQPGFPLASDTGTAGTYYIRIGTVTVAGTDPNKTITIGDPQEVENNLGFRVCGGAGVHYTA